MYLPTNFKKCDFDIVAPDVDVPLALVLRLEDHSKQLYGISTHRRHP
jgi:hypothetical protein